MRRRETNTEQREREREGGGGVGGWRGPKSAWARARGRAEARPLIARIFYRIAPGAASKQRATIRELHSAGR